MTTTPKVRRAVQLLVKMDGRDIAVDACLRLLTEAADSFARNPSQSTQRALNNAMEAYHEAFYPTPESV